MKKEDLRIGNLVYDSLRNKEVKIQLKHFRELAISEKVFFERYKAIELTEEKLLGFGFEDTGVYYTLHIDIDFKLLIIPAYGFYPQIDKADYNGWQSVSLNKIDYTHQLQNLYYSLKNKELPIA